MSDARSFVLRVAGESMTTAQYRVFVLHFFGGWSEYRIAKHYEVSKQSVHGALWGQRKMSNAGRDHIGGGVKKIKAALAATAGGGLMSKLGGALEADESFQAVMAELKAPMQSSSTRSTAGWYAGVSVADFEARAVLLVMHHIAGASGRLHVSSLLAEVPKQTTMNALQRLKTSGHIRTNGIDIEITKLPANPEDTNDHA